MVALLLSSAAKAQPAKEDEDTDARGFTAEVSVGFGMLFEGNTSPLGYSYNRHPGLALSVGAGYFETPRIAVGVRVTDHWRLGHVGTFGPHVQFWLAPNVWLGTGLGVGFLAYGGVNRVGGIPCLDVRLGASSRGGFNISLEAERIGTLGPFSDGRDFGRASYQINAMVGYQWL